MGWGYKLPTTRGPQYVMIECDPPWIKTEDELPEENVWVLTANSRDSTVDTAIFEDDVFKQPDLDYKIIVATHWMPMPEPPQKEKDD